MIYHQTTNTQTEMGPAEGCLYKAGYVIAAPIMITLLGGTLVLFIMWASRGFQ